MTKQQTRKQALEKHYALCEQLGKLTGSKYNGKQISTRLFNLEKITHNGATAFNNGELYVLQGCLAFDFKNDENAWDEFKDKITNALLDILGSIPKGFFVNGDSRGYALKLEENSIDLPMHTDWGRYQILSPSLDLE